MTSDEPDALQEYPTETRLYYGIQYSVSVPIGTPEFNVTIGHGEHAIDETIKCAEVSPNDPHELFRLGHEHAQHIIQHATDELAKKLGLI
ncbi:MAG TPA: hypothetical protein VL995_02145 [Cellvibrio sp.]|nr:hypothetical protein [Cellvibrio sp.]